MNEQKMCELLANFVNRAVSILECVGQMESLDEQAKIDMKVNLSGIYFDMKDDVLMLQNLIKAKQSAQ